MRISQMALLCLQPEPSPNIFEDFQISLLDDLCYGAGIVVEATAGRRPVSTIGVDEQKRAAGPPRAIAAFHSMGEGLYGLLEVDRLGGARPCPDGGSWSVTSSIQAHHRYRLSSTSCQLNLESAFRRSQKRHEQAT